jgi:hypothetical protein
MKELTTDVAMLDREQNGKFNSCSIEVLAVGPTFIMNRDRRYPHDVLRWG